MKNDVKDERHCEPRRGVAIQGIFLLSCHGGRRSAIAVLFFALFLAFPTNSFAADKLDKYDSTYVSKLNMTDEEIAETYGVDSTKINQGPTLQELNEEDPKYIKRDYDHRQQVVVGSVVMLCVAIAMVLMNNYNPKR